jgi:F420H(2)-dependent quinone reductase
LDILHKFFTIINVFFYKFSRGRVGNKLGRQSILVLHTIGRKTGKERITTLSYYRDGENYLVVGSNWGKEIHPGWFHNLMQDPQATIQVGSKTIEVEAHQANMDEYQRLWMLVTRLNSQYIQYQKKLHRRLPIVILRPIIEN